MKKNLFLFVAIAAVLFSSCSSDNESAEQPDGKKFKTSINFSGFKVTTKPMEKALAPGDFVQYAIYNENGGVIISKTVEIRSFVLNDTLPKKLTIDEELAAGKYYIAILTSPLSDAAIANHSENGTPSLFLAKNYFTDVCLGNQWSGRPYENSGICFETTSFEVKESITNNSLNMVLTPMWTSILVKVTNAATCDIPKNTKMIGYNIAPVPYGFNIKDKKPAMQHEESEGYYTYDSFRKDSVQLYITTAETENATIKIIFQDGTGVKIGEETIFQGSIEPAKYINLSGELPQTSGNGNKNSSFNFNIADLEQIDVPFTK